VGIEPDEAQKYIEGLRAKHGGNILLMMIKDQNTPGKVCFSGPGETAMYDALEKVLKADSKNGSVKRDKDTYDATYDVVFRNTVITSGHAMLSLAKSYFPRGRLFVQMLDTIANFGWTLAAAPNFGGVASRDDKGNVTSTVDWPVFVFYKDTSDPEKYASVEHLFLSIKDSNVPGKLCAAGPVGDLEAGIVETFQSLGQKDVKSEKDSYDDDYDVVWRNTSITSGMAMLSFAKSYFPKGKVCVALLERANASGWRIMACPNFGGQGDSWPCFIFRKLKSPNNSSLMVFGSIKDSNLPGKLCLSGGGVPKVQEALLAALKGVKDNEGVEFKKDEYDEDHDLVIHNVHITTGLAAFSLKLPSCPRCDSMMAVLQAMSSQGYSITGCPNFGGMLDSWPTFIWEVDPLATQPMYMAVKDDNIPGKVCFGGGGIEDNKELAAELLVALQTFKGPKATPVDYGVDDYDSTFGFCFKHTQLTTGHATLSWAKPYFPHGYVLEAILLILRGYGWVAVGGPNFGDNGNTWPSIVFTKVKPDASAAVVVKAA
jgi:hypothetical protein